MKPLSPRTSSTVAQCLFTAHHVYHGSSQLHQRAWVDHTMVWNQDGRTLRHLEVDSLDSAHPPPNDLRSSVDSLHTQQDVTSRGSSAPDLAVSPRLVRHLADQVVSLTAPTLIASVHPQASTGYTVPSSPATLAATVHDTARPTIPSSGIATPRSRLPPTPLILADRSHTAYLPRVYRDSSSDSTLSPRTAVPVPTARPHHLHIDSAFSGPSSFPPASPYSPLDMAGTWVAEQRARSPLAEGSSSSPSLRQPSSSSTLPTLLVAPSPSPPASTLLTAPLPVRSPSYSQTLASPCFVHSHLDNSLSDYLERDGVVGNGPGRKRKGSKGTKGSTSEGLGGESTVDEGGQSDTVAEEEGSEYEDDELPSLTRQLAQTAVSVRELSKQLGEFQSTECPGVCD